MKMKQFVENLMTVIPYWHYKVDRPFKQSYRSCKDRMSLETYYCLQMLHCDGPMTMTEMTQRLTLSKQQVTRLINKLCEHDFVRKSMDENDHRMVRIEITHRAINYIQEHFYKNAGFFDGIENKLSQNDLNDLDDAVETLLRILPKLS